MAGDDAIFDGERVFDADGLPITELDLDAADAVWHRGATVAELAARQRAWRFGHVIVDEAQDLSPMQWRMLVRRARSNSMTIVGDLAQRSSGEAGADWDTLLPAEIGDHAFRELTINYRSPAEIDPLAGALLRSIAPDLSNASSIRHAGVAPRAVPTDRAVRPADLDSLLDDERRALGPGKIGVITVAVEILRRGSADPDVILMTPRQSKGLEFDSVVVVEPAAIDAEPHGRSLLYVAVTRTTKRLTFLHHEPLPRVIAALVGASG